MKAFCAQGGAIFFSTHVLEVAEKLCDRVAILRKGQLVREGAMEEVRGDDTLEEVFLELEDTGKRYDPCIAQKTATGTGCGLCAQQQNRQAALPAGAFGYALLFAALMLLVMLNFGSMALPLAVTLVPQGLDWLYFVLMELSALTVSVLASAFTSYGHLFRCRDNQQLLALPIPPGAIFAVRCGGVYLTGLIYLLLAWVPSVVCYALAAPRPGGALLAALPVALALAGVSMVLAVLLGWAVALLNRRARHKSPCHCGGYAALSGGLLCGIPMGGQRGGGPCSGCRTGRRNRRSCCCTAASAGSGGSGQRPGAAAIAGAGCGLYGAVR